MPDITLTFSNDINTSAQVGDTAYYCSPDTVAGFSISTSVTNNDKLFEIGLISIIDNSANTITCTTNGSGSAKPVEDSFILFSKDNRVNMASPLGYYAQVKFKNDSTVKGEMFSTACEIFGSSK
tara:strand:- start:2555 stop:2926 length:372 start_codon:yes stop_codon:yes gene_type:complete